MRPAILALAAIAIVVACVNWIPFDDIAGHVDVRRAIRFWFWR
jgi:hypothetical protein